MPADAGLPASTGAGLGRRGAGLRFRPVGQQDARNVTTAQLPLVRGPPRIDDGTEGLAVEGSARFPQVEPEDVVGRCDGAESGRRGPDRVSADGAAVARLSTSRNFGDSRRPTSWRARRSARPTSRPRSGPRCLARAGQLRNRGVGLGRTPSELPVGSETRGPRGAGSWRSRPAGVRARSDQRGMPRSISATARWPYGDRKSVRPRWATRRQSSPARKRWPRTAHRFGGERRRRRGSSERIRCVSSHSSRSISVVTLCGSPRSTVCNSSGRATVAEQPAGQRQGGEAGEGVRRPCAASAGRCRSPRPALHEVQPLARGGALGLRPAAGAAGAPGPRSRGRPGPDWPAPPPPGTAPWRSRTAWP